jgi:succinoglycan biosynthesis protein ExoL
MHITFLLPDIDDSYALDRIEHIKAEGATASIFGYKRVTYKGKKYNDNITLLGYTEHGKYFRRIPSIFSSFFKIRKKVKQMDVIYCFTLELLTIGWLLSLFRKSPVKLAYDVADIREILVKKGIVSSLVRQLDKFLTTKTNLVVVTAPAYIDGYFKQKLKLQDIQFHIIENKLDEDLMGPHPDTANDKKKDDFQPIRIGYFGVLRCLHSLSLLNDVIREGKGKYHLYLRGFFMDNVFPLKDEILSSGYAEYGGTYISPEDLNDLYGKVDLVWTAIYHAKSNIMWSRTHRFYQACYYKKPMITQLNTPDADQNHLYNIGFSVDLVKKEKALQKILAVNFTDISSWNINMNSVPQEVYLLTDEYKQLLEKL